MPRTRSRGGARAERLEPRTLLAVFTVTTTADAGPGSLRQAILDSNSAAGADTIRFNIPGAGVHTIAPQSPLPDVTGVATIDGRSQPGYAGKPVIELDGSGAGPSADGLVLRAAGDRVEGLAINRFGRHGIAVRASSVLLRNYIGTDPAGDAALGNGAAGVYVASQVNIGLFADDTSGNVISANGYVGVWVDVPSGRGINIVHNRIGTDATGNRALGNAFEGILVDSGAADIGSNSAARLGNLISGNGGSGVRVEPGGGGTLIGGNFIGATADGTQVLPNGTSTLTPFHDGVTARLSTGPVTVIYNLIRGNVGNGVFLSGGITRSYIQLNLVGSTGQGRPMGNGGDGIRVTGARDVHIIRNGVHASGGDGIHIDASGGEIANYVVSANVIGSRSPEDGLGNHGDGIAVVGRTNALIGGRDGNPGPNSNSANFVAGNRGHGVHVHQGGYGVDLAFDNIVTIEGNVVGTNSNATLASGNGGDGVRVAGMVARTLEVFTNFVSGNEGNGVTLVGVTTVPSGTPESRFATATVAANQIGTNAHGTDAIPNLGHGLEIQGCEGGVDVTNRNLISGNAGHGVYVTGLIRRPGSRIEGNYIGIDITGNEPVGNGGSGVSIDGGFGHQVRGGNVISANGGDGVTILGLSSFTGLPSAREITITSNRIGTNAQGGDADLTLGNRGNGVGIYSSDANSVGGGAPNDSAELGNTIAFNAGAGVLVRGTQRPVGPPSLGMDQNLISRNAIFSNGRLGIDLAVGPEGVTPNDAGDADEGPNGLQNAPVLRQAVTSVSGTIVRYAYDGAPAFIEFFGSPAADPSGFGEGKLYLGRANGVATADGVAQVRAVPQGWVVTATAQRRDTSEFSNAVTAIGAAPGAQVSGRRVFYNNSAFDGANPAANAADDGAVDGFKSALLPGGTATFANVTSYPRGINGVMIDAIGLPAGVTLTPDDFVIRSGRSADPATFAAGSAPRQVTVRPFAGVAGGHRVTLVWSDASRKQPLAADSAVLNGWLEITMNAGQRTGLAQADRFYFGNLVGETDALNRPGTMQVNRYDVARVMGVNRVVGVGDPLDINRDARVNALDVAVVRSNLYRRIPVLHAQAATAAAPVDRSPFVPARRGEDLLDEQVALLR